MGKSLKEVDRDIEKGMHRIYTFAVDWHNEIQREVRQGKIPELYYHRSLQFVKKIEHEIKSLYDDENYAKRIRKDLENIFNEGQNKLK